MKKNKPKFLIIHHTGGIENNPNFDTSNLTFEQVNNYHQTRWPDFISQLGKHIGYHYFIEKNGKITQGRIDVEEGAHCPGMNRNSIGIALAGNFNIFLPTIEQKEALKTLLKQKMKDWNILASKIKPDRYFRTTNCYGIRLTDEWAQNLVIEKQKIEILQNYIWILKELIKLYQQLLATLRAKLGGEIKDVD